MGSDVYMLVITGLGLLFVLSVALGLIRATFRALSRGRDKQTEELAEGYRFVYASHMSEHSPNMVMAMSLLASARQESAAGEQDQMHWEDAVEPGAFEVAPPQHHLPLSGEQKASPPVYHAQR